MDAVVLQARLCSRNEHKRRELERVLEGWRIELLDAEEFPPETGTTYYENALAKARFGREVGPQGAWMLGEDSGLEVEALGGAPGVATARWAEGQYVESALDALGGEAAERGARYVCELVALSPEGQEARGRGTLDGEIALAARGSAGFGFDPVFVPAGETRTVAQLGDEWKARHSHRARAARALLAALGGGAASPLRT